MRNHFRTATPLSGGRGARRLQEFRRRARFGEARRLGQRNRAAESPVRHQRRGYKPERRGMTEAWHRVLKLRMTPEALSPNPPSSNVHLVDRQLADSIFRKKLEGP